MEFRLKSRYALLLTLAAASSCAVAPNWQALEQDQSRVLVEPGLDPELPERLADWLQDDLQAIVAVTALPHPEKHLEVYCGFGQHQGGLLGLREGESGRFISQSGRLPRIELGYTYDRELRTLLRHELVHYVLEGHEYPEWLNEGLAEFLSYELATRPSAEDLHHLLHGGLVLAGWGEPLRMKLADGSTIETRLENWLPTIAEVLEMDYADYQREVLAKAGERDPEFHTASHLLVRLLMHAGGENAHLEFMEKWTDGQTGWDAYREITGLQSEAEVLEGMSDVLAQAIDRAPGGRAAEAAFARCSCMHDKFLAAGETSIAAATHLTAFPGGELQAIQLR